MFRWAVENELVSPTVYHGLKAVPGLKQGRTEARESDPVTPVPDSLLATTLPHMTPTLRAMVEVQRLTGMRPGEVCMMRACDLDMSGRVWTYRPQHHKTQHHGRSRVIIIGPKAQEVLRPFLTRDLRAHVFSPARSEAERRMATHAARKTPMSCGNVPGSNRRQDPKRTLGDRYNTTSYGRAIAHACKRAFPPPKELSAKEVRHWHREHRWSPNRLRHTFATDVRREHGLEAAQVLLGHAQADVTQVYAERDLAKAAEVAAKIG
ncbi:MAG: site-specific integrase [bacterium]|nr:site-specific integrase [bacterium]